MLDSVVEVFAIVAACCGIVLTVAFTLLVLVGSVAAVYVAIVERGQDGDDVD